MKQKIEAESTACCVHWLTAAIVFGFLFVSTLISYETITDKATERKPYTLGPTVLKSGDIWRSDTGQYHGETFCSTLVFIGGSRPG